MKQKRKGSTAVWRRKAWRASPVARLQGGKLQRRALGGGDGNDEGRRRVNGEEGEISLDPYL
jgi:hypothetical protein